MTGTPDVVRRVLAIGIHRQRMGETLRLCERDPFQGRRVLAAVLRQPVDAQPGSAQAFQIPLFGLALSLWIILLT